MSTKIDDILVRRLVATQFSQWKYLPVRSVTPGGWDNRTFRLGKQMLVRMPSAQKYATQVEKEHRWLPILAPLLPLKIPVPLEIGKPAEGYPWRWSIYRWLEGEPASSAHVDDMCDFASNLAQFLVALQCIDATGGPVSGEHNFYRGGSLTVYNDQTRQAIDMLKDKIDADAATEIWEAALATIWSDAPVWVHGDIAASNLLVQNGQLSAVIDFGQLAVGDPACDLAIAWTFFTGESREVFRTTLALDAGTWARGRAWALWKSLVVLAGLTDANAAEAAQSNRVVNEVLANYTNSFEQK